MPSLYPVSIAQEARLLSEESRILGGRELTSNQLPIAVVIRGDLDATALRKALECVVARHCALRTTFVRNPRYGESDRRLMLSVFERRGLFAPGFFAQIVKANAAIDIDFRSVECPQDRIERRMNEVTTELCAISADYSVPLQVSVFTFGASTHLLLLVASHTLIDGWSANIIRREICSYYLAFQTRQAFEAPEVRLQSHEMALQEQSAFRRGGLAAAVAYWAAKWEHDGQSLVSRKELPGTLLAEDTLAIASRSIELGFKDAVRLRATAAACRTTDYVVMRCLLALVLHAYTGKTRVTLWANFANRVSLESHQSVANCATQHPIVSELNGTVAQFIAAVDTTLRSAQRHQALSLAALTLATGTAPRIGDTRIMFDWGRDVSRSVAPGMFPLAVPTARRWVDLDVRARNHRQGMTIVATFNAGRYSATGVQRLLQDFVKCAQEVPLGLDRPAQDLVDALMRANRDLWTIARETATYAT